MSDTSTKRAEELAAWNGKEAASLRRSSSPSIPKIAAMIEETATLLRALAAERDAMKDQLAATVPEGHVVVPRVATEEMLKAGHAAHYHIGKHAAHVWTAMVEAALGEKE